MEYVLPDCGTKIFIACLDRIFIEAQNDIYFIHSQGSFKVFCLDSDFFAENHCGLNVQMKVGMYLRLAWPLYTSWGGAMRRYRELSSEENAVIQLPTYGKFCQWEVGQQLGWVSFTMSHKLSASDSLNERRQSVNWPTRLSLHSVYHYCLTILVNMHQCSSTVANKSVRAGYSGPLC